MTSPQNKKILLIHYPSYLPQETATAAAEAIMARIADTPFTAYFSVPYTLIAPFRDKFAPEGAIIGSQVMVDTSPTSFTRAIAAKMLHEVQATFVLIGSGEEKKVSAIDGKKIHEKVIAALKCDLVPIVCLTESEQDAFDDNAKEKLKQQFADITKHFSAEQLSGLHLLYDASWISQGSWQNSDAALQQAYQRFQEVVTEGIDSTTVPSLHLLYSVPAYGPDLASVIDALPANAAGYSLGTVDTEINVIQNIKL